MYLVTAIRDTFTDGGVEIVGVFDTEERAYKAKARVVEWMKNNEYEDYEVFVVYTEVNCIAWYEIEESI